jgi:hypothetical protein
MRQFEHKRTWKRADRRQNTKGTMPCGYINNFIMYFIMCINNRGGTIEVIP